MLGKHTLPFWLVNLTKVGSSSSAKAGPHRKPFSCCTWFTCCVFVLASPFDDIALHCACHPPLPRSHLNNTKFQNKCLQHIIIIIIELITNYSI